MDLDKSVSQWIDGLRDGDDDSVQKLWERYFQQLVRYAGNKLPRGVRRDFDEEDVALSAMKSLCAGVAAGRFPRLDDRDNLWSLLVVITGRKAIDRMTAAQAKKRGGGNVLGESAFLSPADGKIGIGQIVGREPTPQFAADVVEGADELLASLPHDDLRKLVLLKMEGYSNAEAAKKLDCSLRSVERSLNLVRKIWAEHA